MRPQGMISLRKLTLGENAYAYVETGTARRHRGRGILLLHYGNVWQNRVHEEGEREVLYGLPFQDGNDEGRAEPERRREVLRRERPLAGQVQGSGRRQEIVAAVPGDHGACCDAGGLLTATGSPAREPDLCPGDKTGELTSDVTVRPSGPL